MGTSARLVAVALVALALAPHAAAVESRERLPSFSKLESCYPQGTGPEVKQRLGGGTTAAWLGENTCAIRASAALTCAGVRLEFDRENCVRDKNGNAIHYRVRVLSEVLTRRFGAPLTIRKTADEDGSEQLARLQGKKGIIAFTIAFSGATGHIDLWDGEYMVERLHRGEDENYEYFFRASSISFWEAPA